MDNTAQNNQTNNQAGSQVLPNEQAQPQPAPQVQAAQQAETVQNQPTGQPPVVQGPAVTPVSSFLNKERGAVAFSEIVKPSEEEVKVEVELKNVGVVANTDKPKLDKIHEQIGVKASAESVPVSSAPAANITLPLSEAEADKILNTKQSKFNLHENIGGFAGEYTEDSLPFLAALVVKVFKEMHRKIFRRKN